MNRRTVTCALTLVLLLAGLLSATPASASVTNTANAWQTYVPDLSAPKPTSATSAAIGNARKLINAKYLWLKLRQSGVTQAGAAAVLGNVQWESNFDPGAVECGGKCSWSEGLGLVQWSFERRDRMLYIARIFHARWYDMSFQTWYIQYEMQRWYPSVWKMLRTTKNPVQAAVLFHRYYEGSNDSEYVVRAHRGEAARYWYNRLFGYGAGGSFRG